MGMFGLEGAVRGPRALQRQFPHVEAEALVAFAECCEGPPTAEIVAALRDMQGEAMAAARQGPLVRRCALVRQGPSAEAGARAPLSEGELELRFEGGSEGPRAGTLLELEGLEEAAPVEDKAGDGSGACPSAGIVVPSGEVLSLEQQQAPTFFLTHEYGVHELRVRGKGGKLRRCRFVVTSTLGDFAEALDHFNDGYDWTWDGRWTEDLEDASVMLLAALDDFYGALASAQPGGGLGEGVLSTIEPPKRRVEKYLARAVEFHDILALGRAVTAVRAFLLAQSLLEMFSPGLVAAVGVGPIGGSALYECLQAFERARFAAASEAKRAELKAALSKLILTADAHVADTRGSRGEDFAARWRDELRESLVRMRDDPEAAMHPLPFQQLRGGGSGYMADMMASVVEAFGSHGSTVQRAETTEAMCTLGHEVPFAAAEAKVSRWLESLVDDSIGFGSPLTPFEVHPNEPWVQNVKAAVQSLLALGFGYVTQGGKHLAETAKLVALLDRVRATLPLQSGDEFLQDRRRRDRLKDVCRVVRAARKKGQRLVLSVNTDFAGALRALREHHSDSWVGRSLEDVWEKMLPDQTVFSFELWLHDAPHCQEAGEAVAPAPRLVAADFGHPHTFGRVYYVATRFFDRSLRTLQPGFILAFAEAQCLRRAGFELWDLGGVDASPMMQYKPQVALEISRGDFLRRLREVATTAAGAEEAGASRPAQRGLPVSSPGAAPPAGGGRVPTGIVFEDIGEGELWGSAELRAQDEAAAKAWKAQKPAKAAKPQRASGQPRPPKPGPEPAAAAPAPAATAAAAVSAGTGAEEGDARRPASVAPAPEAACAAQGAAAEAAREEARRKFLAKVQQLTAEGLSQTEAVALALRSAAG